VNKNDNYIISLLLIINLLIVLIYAFVILIYSNKFEIN